MSEMIYSTALPYIQQKLTSLLGDVKGFLLGARDGDILGDLEGMSVARLVGSAVGLAEGVLVGFVAL